MMGISYFRFYISYLENSGFSSLENGKKTDKGELKKDRIFKIISGSWKEVKENIFPDAGAMMLRNSNRPFIG